MNRPLKICFDLRVLDGEWSGIASYTMNLARALSGGARPCGIEWLVRDPRSLERLRSRTGQDVSALRPVRFLDYGIHDPRNFFALRSVLKEGAFDLFFTPQYFWPFGMLPCRTVSMIHDIIPLTHPGGVARSMKGRFRRVLGMLTRMSLDKSFRTIVNSETTLLALRDYFGPSLTRRCRVLYPTIPPPSDGPLSRKPLPPGIGDDYILYVGRQDPYKNLERLIGVFADLKQRGYRGRLVLAGKVDPRYPGIRRRALSEGLGGEVVFTGFVKQDVLDSLYARCRMAVQPSLAEGFGLTALEPYRFGRLCAVSRVPAMREIFGEAGLYFDPADSGDMRLGIERILAMDSDEYSAWLEKGRARLDFFSDRRVAPGWARIVRGG